MTSFGSPYTYVGNAIESKPDTTSIKKPVIDSTEIKKQIKQSLAQNFDESLVKRIIKFKERLKKNTWLSWNYRDWQTEQYLNEHK